MLRTLLPLLSLQQLARCQGKYALSFSQTWRTAGSANEHTAQELQIVSWPRSQVREAYCSAPQEEHGAQTVFAVAVQADCT
jgi:hypothetical protein